MNQDPKYTYLLALKILAKKIPSWLKNNKILKDKMLLMIRKLKEHRRRNNDL